MDRGADWAIHRDENGYLVEATAANLFCVTDETIFTPPLRSALAGITRRGVIDAAKALGIECLEMDLTRYDLLTSDEAFLSSAFWGVGAIRSFEGQPLADPVPGPLTSRVREAYVERVLAAGTPIPARVPAGLTVTERPL
jgi:branched-chain amino acid aminotransferase